MCKSLIFGTQILDAKTKENTKNCCQNS
jgi:hypothetical protein